MAKRSVSKALKQLKVVTEKALTSRQIEHAAEEAIVGGVRKSAVRKAFRRAAKAATASVLQAARKGAAQKRTAKHVAATAH